MMMRKKTKKKSFPSIPRPSKSYSRKKSGVYESRDIREDYDGEKNGVGSVVNNNYLLDSSERSTGSSQSRKSSRSVRSFGRKSSFRFGVGGGRSKNKKNKPPHKSHVTNQEQSNYKDLPTTTHTTPETRIGKQPVSQPPQNSHTQITKTANPTFR